MRDLSGSFGDIVLAPGVSRPALVPSADEMAALDANTIASGSTALMLMERAGAEIATHLLAKFPKLRRCVILLAPLSVSYSAARSTLLVGN